MLFRIVLPCYAHRLRDFGSGLGMVMLHSCERPPPDPGEYSLISGPIAVIELAVVLLVGTGWLPGHRNGRESRFVSSLDYVFTAFTFSPI
jgi:hypothetical protein